MWVLGLLAKKGDVKREIKMCSNWNWSKKNKNDVANKKKKKIVMTWKIVGAPKASVLYIYIDYNKLYILYFS